MRRLRGTLAASPQLAAAALTVAAMVAMPAGSRGGRYRRMLTPVVVIGHSATTLAATARHWGRIRAAASVLTLAPAMFATEAFGARHGWPFGRYRYTNALRPQVHGVPAIVPLAWVAMALPAREAAHSALGRRSTPATRIAGTAVALTAWDLFLDPQMVGEGYWRWQRGGRYRGVPVTNFCGWLLVGALAGAALEVLAPPGEHSETLVAEYATVAALNSVGFATVFGDRLVAAVGTLGMGPIAFGAVAGLVGQRS